MGWVGAGILIASACYVLYRYPRLIIRTGTTQTEPCTTDTPPSYSEHNPASVPTKEDVKTNNDSIDSKTAREGGRLPEKVSETAEEEDGLHTTPKASPTGASAVPEVPAFRLDADDTSNNSNEEPQQAKQSVPEPIVVEKENEDPTSMPSPASLTGNSASSLMPPPPLPVRRPRQTMQQTNSDNKNNNTPSTGAGLYPPRPTSNTNISRLQPPPSAASSLRVPRNSRFTNSPSLSPPTLLAAKPQKNSSRRVLLEPGYSPLDWAALTSNPNNSNKLRGVNLPPHLVKVTPSMLKAQNGRKGIDAWSSFQGKVYNITPYLPFHPGGKGELMRGAGRDSGKLFMEVHPWVNWDAMLGECLVGILVSEEEGQGDGLNTNQLDTMD